MSQKNDLFSAIIQGDSGKAISVINDLESNQQDTLSLAINAPSESGELSIIEAARKGQVDVVNAIIKVLPSAVSAQNGKGENALHVMADDPRFTQSLLLAGINPEATNKDGESPMDKATNPTTVKMISKQSSAGEEKGWVERIEEERINKGRSDDGRA
jgi:hypothetical protein